jgi:hypothetical protein
VTELRKIPFARVMLLNYGMHRIFEREVPGEFWALDDDNAMVSCPCGETPCVPFESVAMCECERGYLYDGQAVKVAFSPKDQPKEEPVPA